MAELSRGARLDAQLRRNAEFCRKMSTSEADPSTKSAFGDLSAIFNKHAEEAGVLQRALESALANAARTREHNEYLTSHAANLKRDGITVSESLRRNIRAAERRASAAEARVKELDVAVATLRGRVRELEAEVASLKGQVGHWQREATATAAKARALETSMFGAGGALLPTRSWTSATRSDGFGRDGDMCGGEGSAGMMPLAATAALERARAARKEARAWRHAAERELARCWPSPRPGAGDDGRSPLDTTSGRSGLSPWCSTAPAVRLPLPTEPSPAARNSVAAHRREEEGGGVLGELERSAQELTAQAEVIVAQRERINELEAMVAAQNAEIDRLQAENANLRAKLEDAEKQHGANQGAIDQLTAEIRRLSEELKSERAVIAEQLRAMREGRRSTREDLQRQKSKLLGQKRQEVSVLQSENGKLQLAIDQLSNKLQRTEKTLRVRTRQRDLAKEEIHSWWGGTHGSECTHQHFVKMCAHRGRRHRTLRKNTRPDWKLGASAVTPKYWSGLHTATSSKDAEMRD